MKKILLSIATLLSLLMAPAFIPATASAFGTATCSGNSPTCCNGVPVSVNYGCQRVSNTGSHSNPIFSILIVAINFMAVGVGILVVGGIVWGSFLYVTSNGNSSKSQEAVTIIMNAVIGLFCFAFLYAAVNFLVPGGLFT